MKPLLRFAAFFVALALSVSGGINWTKVWLEPNPVILDSPGSSISYGAKGINGMGIKADLTNSPYLKITSSDDSIVSVDQSSARLIAKTFGRVEIRVSFSEATSLVTATVLDPSQKSK